MRAPQRRTGVSEFHQEKIGLARPHPQHAGEATQRGREPRPLDFDRRAVRMRLRLRSRLQHPEHGLDGELRDCIGLDDLAQQRDHVGVADQCAAARAGQRVGLGEGTQHHQARVRCDLSDQRCAVSEFDVGLVDHHQRAPLQRARQRRMASASKRLPVGLLGEQRNTSLTSWPHCCCSRTKSQPHPASRCNGSSMTAAPCTRAATAYMPKVGGHTSTASAPARQ